MNKKRLIFIIFIFVFSWGLFFTAGMNLFWEDFECFNLDTMFHSRCRSSPTYVSGGINPCKYTLSDTLKDSIIEFFHPSRFIQIGFANSFIDRPFGDLTNNFLSLFFRDNVLFYRIFKAVILAVSACLIFMVIGRISVLWALSGVLLYISSGEMWSTIIGSSNVALNAQVAVLVSIAVFLNLLEKKELKSKTLWIYYGIILVFSQYAVLSKNDGRYLAVIFFLTIILFYRDRILRHLPMLSILFIFEIPVLSFVKKIFSTAPFYPVNTTSYSASRPLRQLLGLIIKNCQFPMIAIGKLILVLLLAVVLAQLFFYLFYKKRIISINKNPSIKILKARIFLFMLWFICTFAMMARARSFAYDGAASLLMGDCLYFMVPFYIFLFHYLILVLNYFNKTGVYRKIFIIFCVTLIMMESFLFKLPRFNHFRGGWGNYFCALANAKKYINDRSDKALALCIIQMPYKPFVFTRSKNEILITVPPADAAPFSDLRYIEAKFKDGNYKDIFVINYGEINFRGGSEKIKLKEAAVLDGNCHDLYDRLKVKLGHPSRKVLNIYHFKLESS